MTTVITYYTVKQLPMTTFITYHTVKQSPMTTVTTYYASNSCLGLHLLPTIQLNSHI